MLRTNWDAYVRAKSRGHRQSEVAMKKKEKVKKNIMCQNQANVLCASNCHHGERISAYNYQKKQMFWEHNQKHMDPKCRESFFY